MPANRVLYRGGVPVAALVNGVVKVLVEDGADVQAEWRLKLVRQRARAGAAIPAGDGGHQRGAGGAVP